MKMNEKTYDVMKWVAQLLLPALATLYVTLAALWNLPCSEAISGTIMAIDLFLGAVLKISTTNYNKNITE